MDLRRYAIPPLVIAAVGTVIYGFDVFDSFSLDNIASTTVIPRQQYPSPSVEKLEAIKLAKPAPGSVQVIDILKTTVANPAIRHSASLIASAPVVSEPVVTAPSARTLSRPIARQDTPLAEDSEQSLSGNSTDSFDDDAEQLSPETPSMATQATPLEMSDDGQIEPASPNTDG